MTYYIGCDAHKHFSLFAVLDKDGQLIQQTRVNHSTNAIRYFLSQFPEGSPVDLESVGNWYWIVSKEQLCRDRRVGLFSKDGPRHQSQGHDGQCQ